MDVLSKIFSSLADYAKVRSNDPILGPLFAIFAIKNYDAFLTLISSDHYFKFTGMEPFQSRLAMFKGLILLNLPHSLLFTLGLFLFYKFAWPFILSGSQIVFSISQTIAEDILLKYRRTKRVEELEAWEEIGKIATRYFSSYLTSNGDFARVAAVRKAGIKPFEVWEVRYSGTSGHFYSIPFAELHPPSRPSRIEDLWYVAFAAEIPFEKNIFIILLQKQGKADVPAGLGKGKILWECQKRKLMEKGRETDGLETISIGVNDGNGFELSFGK